MKAKLNLNQQLRLTPQLQQAIRLLQLSTVDLQQEIQEILETNPLLEACQDIQLDDTKEVKTVDNDDDYQWSTLYENAFHNVSGDKQGLENLYTTTTDLHQHLAWQLTLSTLSTTDKVIGTVIIDACNEDGFLTLPIQDIYQSLKQDFPHLELDEVIAVKHFIQNLDPIGCCSDDLVDCLLVQLNHYPIEDTLKTLVKSIIGSSITHLGLHDYKHIRKEHGLLDDELRQVLKIIHKLHPKPGEAIQQETTKYIIPDVIIKKLGGDWHVSLNNQTLPKLSLNNQYTQLLTNSKDKADSNYLKTNIQEAKWFLKSIQSRQETLLKVAQAIMEKQKTFLEHGEIAMKPLVNKDISTELGLHESTVSRVTTQKYIHTPRGLYELKFFFSSKVPTDSGNGCSSTAIRALIKQLTKEETDRKPLSDSKIANEIAQKGISIARRTVAKYREEMGIPPSSARKKLY